MQLVDLFANIGGLMGLFMGMSVLSLIEFAELAIELLLLAWEEWRSARRVQTTDERSRSLKGLLNADVIR